MADIVCETYINSQPNSYQLNFQNKIMKHQKSCASINFPAEIMNSTSLPNSPSRDNINTINNLLNSQDNSLSNSMDTIAREPASAEIEFLTSNLDKSESMSSKSQSSFNTMSLNNQKRKKSALFSGINNYRNKVISFKKIFSDSDVSNDQLLADYSCALAKNSHGILIQGRLYITEKWICFYSKIMSFENKLILPISGITNVSKEKTAKVIPNAIQITSTTGKYFFTSFGSREKTFTVLQDLLNRYKNHESLNNTQKKNLIRDCYGSQVDIYISEECNMNKVNEKPEIIGKICDEKLENGLPSFVVGDDSDSDTEQSLYSSSLNHPNEIGDHQSIKHRVKKLKSHAFMETLPSDVNMNSNFNEDFLTSTNESNGIFRSSLHHNFSQICMQHDHFQKVFLDEQIDMHVDRLFSCLFTNSSFFRRFAEYRKTFDIVQAPWPEKFDSNGAKERTIYYTITMKAKIGPKISTSEEKQIIQGYSQPGFCYIVDTIVRNGGFPLADCFHCINRYCLIHINAFKSKLKVSSQVVYDKSIFFASKSLIESTAKTGMTDYFSDLASTLKHEAKGLGQNLRQLNVNHNTAGSMNSPAINRLNSPNESSRNPNRVHKSLNESNDSKLSDEFSLSMGTILRPDRAWLILIMLSLIICLCLSFLYSRFRQLEEMTNIEINRQRHESRFETNYDWKTILKRQQQIQIEEISQWKTLVDSSIDLIDQMKNVLVTIKSNLENLDDEIRSNPFHIDSKGKSPK